jgi:ATP-dependent Clp protease, protease subunit
MKVLDIFGDCADTPLGIFEASIKGSAGQKIRVRINSGGLDIDLAAGIVALLKQHGAGFESEILGIAAGSAAWLACAGRPVRMAADGLLMPSRAKGRVVGESGDIRKAANQLDQRTAAMVELFVGRTKLPKNKIEALLAEEPCMSAPAAKEAGFVDEVTGAAAVAHASAPRVAALAELHRKFSLAARSDSRRASALWEQIKRFRRDPGP